jgi:hypothetical protein
VNDGDDDRNRRKRFFSTDFVDADADSISDDDAQHVQIGGQTDGLDDMHVFRAKRRKRNDERRVSWPY